MALANLYRVVQDVQGNVVPEVLGTVMLAGTSTLAALYSDDAGVTPLPNPLVNNATYGSFNVFVGAGLYDMSFVKAGYTFETQRNIPLRDPAAGVNVLSGTTNRVIVTPPTGIGNVTLSTPQDLHPDASLQFAHLGLGTPATGNALEVSGVSTFTGTLNANAVAITGGTATFTGTVNTTVGRLEVKAGMTIHDMAAGDNQIALYANMLTAGGAGRWFLRHEGTAPSYFGGAVTLAGGATRTDQGGSNVYGYVSNIVAAGGSNRYAFFGQGDAPSYFGGTVQVMGASGIGIGTAPQHKLTVLFDRANQAGIVIQPNADSGAGGAMWFTNAANAIVGSITTTATATAYNTSSDVRLKHSIAPLTAALARIGALRPVSYFWNADNSPGVGFLAHELQVHIPDAVTGEPDQVNEDGSVKPQQVDHSKVVPWLTAAVQELTAQVEALQARVATLEAA